MLAEREEENKLASKWWCVEAGKMIEILLIYCQLIYLFIIVTGLWQIRFYLIVPVPHIQIYVLTGLWQIRSLHQWLSVCALFLKRSMGKVLHQVQGRCSSGPSSIQSVKTCPCCLSPVGVTSALHLDHPKWMPHSLPFIQSVMLGLGSKKLPPKLISLVN